MAMGAVLALFGIFLILPLILTLSGGFESKGGIYGISHLEVFRDPLLRAGLLNSLWIAVAVTACACDLTPLAFLEARPSTQDKACCPPPVGAIDPAPCGQPSDFAIFLAEPAASASASRLGILDQPLDLLADGGWPAVVWWKPSTCTRSCLNATAAWPTLIPP